MPSGSGRHKFPEWNEVDELENDQTKSDEMLSDEGTIKLGMYHPWQTTAQPTHMLGHSSRTHTLVHLAEFTGLQQCLNPDDDPYGLEMATFLDMSFVASDDKEKDNGIKVDKPSLFTTVKSKDKCLKPGPHQNKASPKKKKQKTSGKVKGKKKVQAIQSSLITHMLSQKFRPKVKEDTSDFQDMQDFEEKCTPKKDSKDLNDNDDDIICLMDDNTDVNSQDGTGPVLQEDSKILSQSQIKSDPNNMCVGDQPELTFLSTLQACPVDMEFLPPPILLPPLQVRTPPSDIFETDEEIEEPISPSEVLKLCDDWVENKKRVIEDLCRSQAARALDVGSRFDLEISNENFKETLLFNPNELQDNNSENELPNLNNFDGKVNRKSSVALEEESPIHTEMIEGMKTIQKQDAVFENGGNQNVTPIKTPTIAPGHLEAEVSPILSSTYRKPVRTNIPLYSSTPKVNAKRLFKLDTPTVGLSSISSVKENLSYVNRLCEVDQTGVALKERTANKEDDIHSSPPLLSQRSRLRSKLSKFALKEFKSSGNNDSSIDVPKHAADLKATKQNSKGYINYSLDLFDDSDDMDVVTSFTKSAHISAKETKYNSNNNSTEEIKSNSNKNYNPVRILKSAHLLSSVKENTKDPSSIQAVEARRHNSKDMSRTEVNQAVRTVETKVSHEVENPKQETRSDSTTVNFCLSLDDDLFADLDEGDFDVPTKPTVSTNTEVKVHHKEVKTCVNQSKPSLLGVTQILDFVNTESLDEVNMSLNETKKKTFHISEKKPVGKLRDISTFQSPHHSNIVKLHHSFTNENVTNMFSASTRTSKESIKAIDKPKLCVSSPHSGIATQEKIDKQMTAQQTSQDQSVNFDLLGDDELDLMSESLLADIDENIKIRDEEKVNSNEYSHTGNSSSEHKGDGSSLLPGMGLSSRVQSHKEEDHHTEVASRLVKSPVVLKAPDMTILPTQEAHIWQRRKRKMGQVVESDHEDSAVDNSDSEVSKRSSSCSDNSICFGNKLKNKNCEVNISFDDNFDFVEKSIVDCPRLQQKVEKKGKATKKIKRKTTSEFIEVEAEVSREDGDISSDETDCEEELDDYDGSFVDDCTQLSQDTAVDMKAVYLQSIARQDKVEYKRPQLPPPPPNLPDTDESWNTEEHTYLSDDSFVVDNNHIEYDTEYIGESMLAEDPIICQAILDKANAKKTKNSKNGGKGARKRIILPDSSSDDDVERNKKMKCSVTPQSHSEKENKSLPKTPISDVMSQKTEGPKLPMVSNMSPHTSYLPISPVNKNRAILSEKSSVVAVVRPLGKGSMSSNNQECKNRKQEDIDMINKMGDMKKAEDVRNEERLGVQPAAPLVLCSNTVSMSGIDSRLMARVSGQVREPASTTLNVPAGPSTSKLAPAGPSTSKLAPAGPSTSKLAPAGPSTLAPPATSTTVISVPSVTRVTSTTLVPSAVVPAHGSHSPGGNNLQDTLKSSQDYLSLSQPANKASTQQMPPVVLVDSSELNRGGSIMSGLRLHHGAQTAVVHLSHAHYVLSTRMAVMRLTFSVFNSRQQRGHLVDMVQGLLELYERPVVLVETDYHRPGEVPRSPLSSRSRYLDTITCACTQVTQLKLLYSSGHEETTRLLVQLMEQERTKGYFLPVLPNQITKLQQVINFYRSLPRVSFATALCLAHNFRTVADFINSSAEVIRDKGNISQQRAVAVKEHLTRHFRADMLPQK